MSRARYDLIVFDWDGTLMDSAGKIARCFASALTDVGIESPGEAAIRNIIGLGLAEAVSALLPGHSETTRAAVVERYREHFLHLDPGESELFPGVATGLERLNEQGYLLAVATGKSRRGLERVLGTTALQPLFVVTRCADETFSKPHPQMLHDILERTGTEPERALMVGDTVYDLEMARNARVDGLGVSYGVHDRVRLLELGPRAVVDSFNGVCDWLD